MLQIRMITFSLRHSQPPDIRKSIIQAYYLTKDFWTNKTEPFLYPTENSQWGFTRLSLQRKRNRFDSEGTGTT